MSILNTSAEHLYPRRTNAILYKDQTAKNTEKLLQLPDYSLKYAEIREVVVK